MAWPAADEFLAAVQSSDNFAEPVLRSARPAFNALDLPIAACGNFAAVFRMESAGGRLALRCFLRDLPGREKRYDLVRHWLEQKELPWLLPFRYLARGIRVAGAWRPVVLMGWVQGETLDAWINRRLGQPGELGGMAAKWQALTEGLRAAGVAHGDLQAGNIMVDEAGNLKLVDYDSLFVPPLGGGACPELGHAAYQHPGRRPDQCGPAEGDFASLVIYVSLIALEEDPTLWQEFHDGGENLIFGARDFLLPRQSRLLDRLRSSPDPRLAWLTARLDEACRSARPQPAPLAEMVDRTRSLPAFKRMGPGEASAPAAASRRACPVPVSPAPGETLEPGTQTLIKWRPVPAAGSLRVELLREGRLERILSPGTPASAGSMPWTVPLSSGSRFQVRLGLVEAPSARAVTNGEFRILPKSLARRLELFDKTLCSRCGRFYTEPPACPYDYIRPRCAFHQALAPPERDLRLREDRWWPRITTLVEKSSGDQKA